MAALRTAGWVAAGVAAAVALALAVGGRALVFGAVTWLVGRGKPELRWVEPEALAGELAGSAPPVLLDVREAPEFAVSHLPGARRLPPGELPAEVLALPRATPVVTYCAVGVRAAAAARQLQAAGFSDVRVLAGSIFAWANAGRPLVNAGGATPLVHPVGPLWRLALAPAHRGALP
ncbi:MAG: rhodanese-like domain-containing protein [Gemmatimonadetes bacterium]|nr:rhodanese-like domain-containing protein [Gemmatimonadota bacterium]